MIHALVVSSTFFQLGSRQVKLYKMMLTPTLSNMAIRPHILVRPWCTKVTIPPASTATRIIAIITESNDDLLIQFHMRTRTAVSHDVLYHIST